MYLIFFSHIDLEVKYFKSPRSHSENSLQGDFGEFLRENNTGFIKAKKKLEILNLQCKYFTYT